MPDLKDQIRTYYEVTTEPVDIDAISVDPGTVLVGPFPGAAQRRSAMQTVTPETPSTNRLRRGLVTAAAVALIVVIAGVTLLRASGGGEVEPAAPTPTTQPTDTTQATPDEEAAPAPEITVEEALEVVDNYWRAYDAGDFTTVEALFTADATTERFSRAEFFAWLEQYRAWLIAQGTTQTPRECTGRELFDGTIFVTCRYGDLPVLHEAVGAPPVRIQISMNIVADGIQTFWFNPSSPNYDTVTRPFLRWLEEHHPDDAPPTEYTMPITRSNSVEEAERIGTIRAEYAELWAAYLEANDCTYREVEC